MKNPFVITSLFLFLLCSIGPSLVHAQNFMPDQYLFGPSAIPMEKGEIRYRNNGITLNSLHLGISNHVSVDMGAELLLSSILIMLGEGGLISFANVKYGHSFHENFHLGAGVFIGGMLSTDAYNRSGFVSPYGIATFGNTLHNVSIALGAPIESEYHPSFLMLSGKLQLTKKLDLISENYLLHQSSENSYVRINGSMEAGGKNIDRHFVFSLALRIYSGRGNLDLGISSLYNTFSYTIVESSNGQQSLHRRNSTYWFPIPIPVLGFTLPFR